MFSVLRNTLALALFALFISNQAKAQSKQEQSIDVSIGLGVSLPYDNVNVSGTGFYAQGEYVYGLLSWVDVRPYAGLLLTCPNKNDYQQGQPEYKATTKAFLMGGKARITAPIPYVAPYIEGGIGASIGSFETFTPYTHIKDSGLQAHFPFSIGLELGRDHNVDVAFTYYFHPGVEQIAGAAAFGLLIPINKS